jgi:putative metallohydrolase (TIGR04338 family)
MRRPRDNQRSTVYAWGRKVEGYYREPEFTTVAEVERWARPIWRAERGRYGLARSAAPEFIPAHWGQRSAIAHNDHRISLPRWARQRPVVLHEMAHRLTPGDEAHGPRFVGVHIGLLARHLDYDAYELMALADEMGVNYHVRSIGTVPVITLHRKVEKLIEKDGPMPEMWIACALDVSYLSARGAALQLIRRGRARWFRKRLTLLPQLKEAA